MRSRTLSVQTLARTGERASDSTQKQQDSNTTITTQGLLSWYYEITPHNTGEKLLQTKNSVIQYVTSSGGFHGPSSRHSDCCEQPLVCHSVRNRYQWTCQRSHPELRIARMQQRHTVSENGHNKPCHTTATRSNWDAAHSLHAL